MVLASSWHFSSCLLCEKHCTVHEDKFRFVIAVCVFFTFIWYSTHLLYVHPAHARFVIVAFIIWEKFSPFSRAYNGKFRLGVVFFFVAFGVGKRQHLTIKDNLRFVVGVFKAPYLPDARRGGDIFCLLRVMVTWGAPSLPPQLMFEKYEK